MVNMFDCNENGDVQEKDAENELSLSTQEKLSLASWGLPEGVLEFYKKKGINQMLKWQLECLTIGKVLEGGNLVYSAPTSAGKTLVAEILIAQTVFERQKKVLIILPFVSVVREKMFYFKSMLSVSGIRVEGYMGGHSPSISFQQVNVAVCTIEKANSLINRLMEEKALHKLGLIVVDELHLIGDPYRGYLLELLLTKLKYMSLTSENTVQIVGMSATLPNLKIIANWLNADLYYTDFRPVPLSEKLKCGQTIYDKKLNKIQDLTPMQSEVVDDSENVGQLCLETIQNGHSILIFCPTKVWCENLSDKIATFFRKHGCSKSATVENSSGWILRKELNLQKINEVIEHLKACPVGLDKDLHKTVAYAVGFHHAGLTLDERDIIEGSFRKGILRVLCATSTLSSGVNLPARRVIVRSPMSFGGVMDILTYRQMIGRAGRMGVDTEGESILICKPTEKVICQQLMNSNLKPIESCLGSGRLSASLKRAILEVVASGVTSTPEQVKAYTSCTFLAFSSKCSIEDPIQTCIQFLIDNEFIRLQEGNIYAPTPLGQACLASSLPPDEGLSLFRELQRARRCFVLDTDLHIIYQVTPYSVSEQWSKIDWMTVLNVLEELPETMKRVGDLVGVEESFLVRVVKGSLNPNAPENRSKLSIHRRFYTSLALQDLVNEIPLAEVARKYNCNKGTLQSLQQSAATYAGMVTEFSKRLGWGSVELIVSHFQERLQFGIQRELCELMRLPQLNGVRARALYNSGFTSLSSIANADVSDLENALHGAAPFQTRKIIAGETSFEREERNKLQTLWVTGRADLTIRQAAEILVTESRSLLEIELGLEDVKWGRKGVSELSIMTQNQSQMSISMARIGLIGNKNKTVTHNITNTSSTQSEENSRENSNSQDVNSCCSVEMVKSDCENSLNQQSSSKNHNGTVVSSEAYNVSTVSNRTASVDKSIQKLNKSNAKASKSVIAEEAANKTDYFAQSLNIDGLLDSVGVVNETRDENKSMFSDDESSDSSIEIVYHKTPKSAVKVNPVRYSGDMFEMPEMPEILTEHKFSTPNPVVNKLKSQEQKKDSQKFENSPDLFSESLTFDTQLQRMLDFDDPPCEEVDLPEAKPSTSLNSDDLGFVSDSDLDPSPPKPGVSEAKKPDVLMAPSVSKLITESFFAENFESQIADKGAKMTKTESGKRKNYGCDSPDVIMGSDDSYVDELPLAKKAKISAIGKTKSCSSRILINSDESDDEIIGTPKMERTCSISKLSWTSRSMRQKKSPQKNTFKEVNSRSRCASRTPLQFKPSTKSKVSSAAPDPEKSSAQAKPYLPPVPDNWDKLNIVNVTADKESFQSFCDEIKYKKIVGIALGCREQKEDAKSVIGSKIMKKKSITKKEVFNCRFGKTVLDGIAFYWKASDVFYVSMDDGCISLREKLSFLESISQQKKVIRMFDSREQIKMLKLCTSVIIECLYEDPKIASWLCSEAWKESNISDLVHEHLSKAEKLVSSLGDLSGHSSPGLLSKSCVAPRIRASVESFLSFHLIERLTPVLRRLGLNKVFRDIEMGVALCLAEMELHGFKFDRTKLLEIKSQLENSRAMLEKKASSFAGYVFSLNSPAAISRVLYTELNLGSKEHLTKKKKLSTSKDALMEMAAVSKHPLPGMILQWRKMGSVISKVLCPLLRIPASLTRVHPISQSFTITGRIAMHEPNLQSIPRDFEIFEKIGSILLVKARDIFIASEDHLLIAADYRQIELRLLAHLSEDETLINSINSDSDVFISIAAGIYNIPKTEVTDEARQKAKQTCYGMIYGIGARALSQQLSITEEDAAALMEDFKNKHQGVRRYLEKTVEDCRKNGYVTSLCGRRRYLPAINDTNPAIRSEAERQAVNTTIQGSAADLSKIAMIRIRDKIRKNDLSASLVLHLHDELIYEAHKDEELKLALILKDAMENAYALNVPIPAKLRRGPSWGQLEELENAVSRFAFLFTKLTG